MYQNCHVCKTFSSHEKIKCNIMQKVHMEVHVYRIVMDIVQ